MRKNLLFRQNYFCHGRSWHFLMSAFFVLLFSSMFAQTVGTQSFSATGFDDDNFELAVVPGDITVNGGAAITGIAISDFTVEYLATGNMDECGDWYDFDLSVTGGTSDGVNIAAGCVGDFMGLDVTDFTNISIISNDLDSWSDEIEIILTLEVTYDDGGTGGGDDLLVIDLTTENQLTITATTAASAATASGSTFTGFYFENLFSNAGTQVLGTTTIVGTATLTAASVPTDNSPTLFRPSSGTDPGLNIYSYSGTSTTTFTTGEQAFTGDATWTITPELYTALLTAPESGNVYFPADGESDLATATMLGTYSVIMPGGGGGDCEWTVHVWDDDYWGDEVEWELRDSGGTALISGGGYGDGYDDTQTVTAEGPLTFWITNDGFWGDNEPSYEVSNENGVILTGQLEPIGTSFESSEMNCSDEALVECSGVPVGGTASANPTSGPSGAVSLFTVTGYSSGDLGLTYDWEYSVNGGAWTSTGAPADTVNFTITGNHGDEFTVRYAVTCTNSGETAYSNEVTYTIDDTNCTPTFTNTTDYIENFQLEDIENMGSGFSAGGYGDFTAMSTDLDQDMVYTASLTSSAGSGNHAAAAWIDFDDDGLFDVSERVGTADAIGASATVDLTITIPAGATPGEHRLRVVYQYGTALVGTDILPCASAAYGEGEDYMVNILGGATGSGNTCDDAIVVTGPLPYDDAGNTADHGDNIDYDEDTFPPLAPGVVGDGTPGYNHYYMSGDDVVYSYTPTSDALINVSTTNGTWTGLFAYKGCPFTSTVGYHTSTTAGTRLIEGLPVTAGETYYFVISTWTSPQSTEYTIHIEEVEGCEGTPEGGTAAVDPASGPSGATANFTVSGYTDEVGVTYDWEYSVNGDPWVSTGTAADDVNFTITGEQGDEFTVRYAVTCSVSGETAYSNEVTYTIDNTDCTPTFSNTTDYIENFQLEDIENMGSGFSAGGYGDFTAMSTDLNQDMAYTASLTSSSGSGNHAAAAWIDFNDDNVFDVSERVGTADGIGPGATADLTITIPADAAPGAHRLRVIYQYGTTLVGTDISPCASASFGEGEDYTVNITGGEEPEGCLDAENGQYPTGDAYVPTCSGAPETITALAWTGEYSLVQVTAGTEYVFSSSINTDFVTIGNEDGTVVLASGTTPVTWTADSDQLIRFYLHFDSDCNWAASGLRSRIIQCGDILPPPANDDCADAIALACGDSDSGATTFATNSGGNDAGDVFYTFTGTGTEEMVTVSLCGSGYDTTVRVFSDCSLTNEVAFNDDAGTGDCAGTLQSEVTFFSDGTSTYIIMVEGYSANVGNYEIALSCALPPVEPDYGCDQTYDAGIFDLANSISGDLGYTMANDFFVPMESETYQIESVTLLLLPIAGSDADFDTFDITILSDNAATPGTPVDGASWTGLTGTSELYPETFAGYNTYMVTLDLGGFELPVDTGADSRYWIQVTGYSASAQNIFWVGYPYTEGWNTASNYQSEDGGATWTQITYDGVGDHYDSFWSIDATCELGVNDMNSFDFTYYPNPVKDYLTIDAKNPVVNINVHNLAGQTVMQDVQLKDGKLNMSNLSSGVYVFRVTLEGGQIETFKVIKK